MQVGRSAPKPLASATHSSHVIWRHLDCRLSQAVVPAEVPNLSSSPINHTFAADFLIAESPA